MDKIKVISLKIGDRVLIENEGCLTVKKILDADGNDNNKENMENKYNVVFEEGQVKQYKWKYFLNRCGG